MGEGPEVETDPQYYIDQAESAIAEAENEILHHPNYTDEKAAVSLPAGSVDGLQAAIAQAGPWGKVVVQSGMHYESGTVTVTHPVRIIGKKGAVIQTTTVLPSDPQSILSGIPFVADPAIFVKDANFVQVRNLDFVPDPTTGQGSTGILAVNSNHVYIRGNSFSSYLNAVIIHESDFATIIKNEAEGLYSEGFTGYGSYGFTVATGRNARVFDNYAEDYQGNFFVSDERGIYLKNTSEGGEVGFIYCTYSANLVLQPDGTPVGASIPAKNWLGVRNTANNHVIGHLVIDGSNNCTLVSNAASNCLLYEVEFVGATTRLDPLVPVAPVTFDNLFIAGSEPNIQVKDCGVGNTIIGGNQVDLNVDPCF